MEPPDWPDAEAMEENEGLGVGDTILIACERVFFFLFVVGGRTAGDEPQPFSSGTFLNVPSCLFSSR